jgi:hypothetical protein
MSNELWGPLAGLIGTWEGDQGIDVAFHNEKGAVGTTKFRERVTFEPFGPVDNGKQKLYGLDYRMAGFRFGEESAFHTEVGYWLWDAADGQVMRCFMVPRGTTLIAGGTAKATDKTLSFEANVGSEVYGILSNPYLTKNAKTTKYTCSVTIEGDTFSYESTTSYVHFRGGAIAHTDKNTLRRVR